MEQRRGTVESLMNFWQTASAGNRIAIGIFVLAAIVLTGIVIRVSTQPDFAPLYSNLRQEDAAQIVAKLDDAKIAYRLSSGGATVEVPTDKVYDIRLKMAQEGLPKGSNVGFEIFDNSRVGLTDFGEHINYQRALQGELERTIAELDSVESARVHLAIPEQSLFTEQARKPSASVVLKFNGSGQTLTPQEIRGVAHLVASAVQGLAPEEVKVLDSSGKLLSNGAGLDVAGGDGEVVARLQMKRDFEMQLEQKVQSMLEEVAGQGKAIVRISADLDFDKKELEQSTFEPGATNGVLDTQQEMKETYTGSKARATSGVPGMSSNAGSQPMLASAGGGADSYEKTETNNKFNVNKRVEHSVVAPGQIKGLSMALFVDESLGQDEVSKIEKAAAAAAGLDVKRGDEIVVESLTFASAAEEDSKDKKAGATGLKDFYLSVGKDAVAVVLLLIFLFFVKSLFKSAGVSRPGTAKPELTPALASAGAGEVVAGMPAGLSPIAAKAPTNGESALNNIDSEKMAQAIRSLMSDSGEG
jgi:flagellar M-ring protein FliF